MKNIIIIIAFLSMLSCLDVAAAGNIDLQQEYRKLDKAIEKTDSYVQERENRIQKFKTALEVTNDLQAQYEMCHKLFEEYRSYVSDSAIFYIGRCIELADKMGDQNSADQGRLLLAFQCTESLPPVTTINTIAHWLTCTANSATIAGCRNSKRSIMPSKIITIN